MDTKKNQLGESLASHAVIPISASTKNNEDYKVKVYDVNSPGEVQVAYINTKRNTFSLYGVSGYNCLQLVDVNSILRANKTLHDDIAKKIQNPEYQRSTINTSTNTISVTNCNEYAILDDKGNDITKNVETLSFLEPKYHVYQVPKGKYKVVVNEIRKETRVSAYTYDAGVSYYPDAKSVISVEIHKNKSVDSTINFVDGMKHDFFVKTFDKDKNVEKKKVSSIMYDLHGENNKSRMGK